MNKVVHSQNALDSAQSVFPLGYDSRLHTRFSLERGGYVAHGVRNDHWFDTLRADVLVNVRDISIAGPGLLSKAAVRSGLHLLIPTPSGSLLRVVVIRQQPDPQFLNLYQLGCHWCKAVPMKVLAEWEPYIRKDQLRLFREITGTMPSHAIQSEG